MDEFEQIYTDLIMEHSMHSANKKQVPMPTFSVKGNNPNCGDEIALQVKLENHSVADLGFSGYGCAISQSSTSIMIDILKGKSTVQAGQICTWFIKMIKGEKLNSLQKEMLGDALAFENISNMPARVKCALLPWVTMQNLLENLE